MIYDFIIAGSGIAGLSFALNASKHGSVLIVTKQSIETGGSTPRAQGGIATVMDPLDSLEQHISDTIIAGAGLCDAERVKLLVNESKNSIQSLIKWGVLFSKATENSTVPFDLLKEGGHSNSRILHSEDLTGKEIQRALVTAVKKNKNIKIYEHMMAVDIITHKHTIKTSNARCYGLYIFNTKLKTIETVLGNNTILCTGGMGQLYRHTTNDQNATGDAVAMAYRANLTLENMEFMQFHPTSLYDPNNPPFLISEALRGFGGILRNTQKFAFMEGIHPLKDLAPRDIVARAIDNEIKKSGEPFVYLDMTVFSAKKLKTKFPNIYQHCYKKGIDMSKNYIPIVPSAHFACGGVQVNEHSTTSLPHLYVCGEAASTKVHGANRLASNSLLEGVVFSNQAFRHILQKKSKLSIQSNFIKPWDSSQVKPAPEVSLYSSAKDTIKSIMSDYVGIVRSNNRLNRAKKLINVVYKQINQDYEKYTLDTKLIETRNLATVAKIMIESTLQRKESRGLHFNLDYPKKSNTPTNTLIQKL